MTRTGREPATMHICSLRHERQQGDNENPNKEYTDNLPEELPSRAMQAYLS